MSWSTNNVQEHNKEERGDGEGEGKGEGDREGDREGEGKIKSKEEGKSLILLKTKVNLESLKIISDILGSSQDFLCFYLSGNSLSKMFAS